MGLGAARDELATLQLTELHPLPQAMERQECGLPSIKSGLAALRDFDPDNVRLGSITRMGSDRPYVSFRRLRT